MKFHLYIAIAFTISFSCISVQAYTITAFDAANFFSPGSAPTPGQTANLDNTVGINDFIIEDFEDNNLINGLSMSLAVAGTQVDPAPPSTFANTNKVAAIWDGTRSLVASVGGEGEGDFGAVPGDFDAVFRYSPGANSFSIGVGDINQDIRLVVNGTDDLGIVRDLPGYNITFDDGRDAYLLINVSLGDAPITEVRFVGTPSGDGVFFDHLAVDRVVPEPSSCILMLLAIFASAFGRKR